MAGDDNAQILTRDRTMLEIILLVHGLGAGVGRRWITDHHHHHHRLNLSWPLAGYLLLAETIWREEIVIRNRSINLAGRNRQNNRLVDLAGRNRQ